MNKQEFLDSGFVSPNHPEVMGTCDSESIQNAVKLAKELDINKVVIPRYNRRTGKMAWEITESIVLGSDITVVLDDCYMRMADDVMEHFFVTDNFFKFQPADAFRELSHISIIGKGHPVLDDGNPNTLSEPTARQNGNPSAVANSPILFYNVRHFTIQNITITNQRYWAITLIYCKEGRLADMHICARGNTRNQDGIDLRNGCHNILIENIYGQSGDDFIALSAIDVQTDDEFNFVYPELDNDIHGIVIRDITACALTHPMVALRAANGVKIYDVLMENLRDIHYDVPVDSADEIRYTAICIGNNSYFRHRPVEMGEIHSITIRNLSVRYSERAILLDRAVRDIFISDVFCADKCCYGITTSYWAEGVQLENVFVERMSFRPDPEKESFLLDFRQMEEGRYVKNMRLRNVYTEKAQHIGVLSQDFDVAFENLVKAEMKKQAYVIAPGSEDKVKITEE